MAKKHSILIIIISLLIFLVLIVAAVISNPRYRNAISRVFPFLGTTALEAPASPRYVAPQRTLTVDEQEALNIPLDNGSMEEKRRHAAVVAKLVKTAPELDISGCKPEPLVYRVNLKGSFEVKNNDDVLHSIRYARMEILVPERGTTSIKASQLFSQPGDYGYGCDNPFAKMGVFMVR